MVMGSFQDDDGLDGGAPQQARAGWFVAQQINLGVDAPRPAQCTMPAGAAES